MIGRKGWGGITLLAAMLVFAGCPGAPMLGTPEAAAPTAAPAKTSDHDHPGLLESTFERLHKWAHGAAPKEGAN